MAKKRFYPYEIDHLAKMLRFNRLGFEEALIRAGVDVPRCSKCGYTSFDCLFELDHNICGEPTPLSGLFALDLDVWDDLLDTPAIKHMALDAARDAAESTATKVLRAVLKEE